MLECKYSLWSGLAVKGDGVGWVGEGNAWFLYLLVYKYETEG